MRLFPALAVFVYYFEPLPQFVHQLYNKRTAMRAVIASALNSNRSNATLARSDFRIAKYDRINTYNLIKA